MGSFYLVNVILAIVAMAYDDCRKQEALEADEEEQVRSLFGYSIQCMSGSIKNTTSNAVRTCGAEIK